MNKASIWSYISFWIVMIGIVILNVTEPPLQLIGLAIFMVAIIGALG